MAGNTSEFTFEFLPRSSRSTDSNPLEVDPNPEDVDSMSLSESVMSFPEEFGRTYNSYRHGSYNFPNDSLEKDRLDLQFYIIHELMRRNLFFAPLTKENPPKRVLDIGTGTGIWVIEFADQFPESHVVGIDLSPIQPEVVPTNVHFYVEDATDEWSYSERYDYIHTRLTLGCWANFKTQIIQQAFDNLEPGGWLECQELEGQIFSDDGTVTPDGPLMKWANDLNKAADLVNRPIYQAGQIKNMLQEVGFVDVKEYRLKLPSNTWPKERFYKEIGKLEEVNLKEGLSGFTVRLFNAVFGQTPEEIELSLVPVRRDISDTRIHAYHMIFIVVGRKPGERVPDPFPASAHVDTNMMG